MHWGYHLYKNQPVTYILLMCPDGDSALLTGRSQHRTPWGGVTPDFVFVKTRVEKHAH
jgi:hypothetical protein